MPNYNDIENEIMRAKLTAQDTIRHKYLKELAESQNKDVIIYAAATNKQLPQVINLLLGINGEDITSFMTVLNGMCTTPSKELILIIHSYGGSLEDTEQIVSYLRTKYTKITAIIPQSAMSAATLLSCACEEIILAKHSAMGPIDPQINGIPAHAILKEFEKAAEAVSNNPNAAPLWLDRIKNLPFGILTICEETGKLSKEKASKWLSTYMFAGDKDGKKKAAAIAEWLGNFSNHKTHGHPVSIQEAREIGLKVTALEDNPILQDQVLSVFHATMATFAMTPCIKIVENHKGQGRYLKFDPNSR
jgi:ATP-dependent protease ClpP protease subunit